MRPKNQAALAAFFPILGVAAAFISSKPSFVSMSSSLPVKDNDTSLAAIGVLAKKAKEAELRRYVEAGVPDDVMEKFREMKSATEEKDHGQASATLSSPGPLQLALTKRKGTITVIAEYKRKVESDVVVGEEAFLEPDILSSTFREFGASAVAVMADERIGGCTYDDLREVKREQRTARGDVPGPLPVISSDVIVDEIQVARAAASGADAVLLIMAVVGADSCTDLIGKASALGLESVVSVSNAGEAQAAVDAGARIICAVGGTPGEKAELFEGLSVPEGETICKVAGVAARADKSLEEVEEVWILRDKGFNSVWVADCLYKQGDDPAEHAGAIIRSMVAKSSVKWASPKARSGKGEGAREYLGDIMM